MYIKYLRGSGVIRSYPALSVRATLPLPRRLLDPLLHSAQLAVAARSKQHSSKEKEETEQREARREARRRSSSSRRRTHTHRHEAQGAVLPHLPAHPVLQRKVTQLPHCLVPLSTWWYWLPRFAVSRVPLGFVSTASSPSCGFVGTAARC